MGRSKTRYHFSAPHKASLGWAKAKLVLWSGTYYVAPTTSSNTSLPHTLRIPKGSSLDGDAYWVSYRESVGFDTGIYTRTTPARVGALLHVWDGNAGPTKLLDLSPGSQGGLDDAKDAAFIDGQTFSHGGVKITQLSHTSSWVKVRVEL